ncbi:MAG: aspartate--tRNA ligase [Elusimicrobia bacterium]|nr:aspartate--tRNA ligase [Elusimicrobiota bacterium]
MLKRTVTCGELRAKDKDREVVLSGWVASWRDHGGVIFIDLRDISGLTQIVFGREKSGLDKGKEEELIKQAQKLRNEFVIAVKGVVSARPEGTENKKIDTGDIEVIVTEMELLNKCRELPFDFKKMDEVGEETRLKYRYLEMRVGKLKDNLVFKHKLFQVTRNYFSGKGFYEIETPFLTRATPEGARDYLVPSRVNPGKFYALPQSPQLFKQMLMVGGFMRYFQIVKCFRDEDLRQDRQPEFTQLDLEMSFIDEADIKAVLEEYVCSVFDKLMGVKVSRPFPSLSYDQAMLRYGTDKPDLRIPAEITDISDLALSCGFKVFSDAAGKGVVRGLKISDADRISLSVINEVTKEVQQLGAKGLAWIRHKEEGLTSQITKFFKPEELEELSRRFKTIKGDLLFFVADSADTVSKCLSFLRTRFYEPRKDKYALLWVEDYPLFEKDAETGRWSPMHHPFTSPAPGDIEALRSGKDEDIARVKSRAYDMVLNGSEIGGGSIRNHSLEVQDLVFRILGIDEKESREKFGFLLKALSYGAPPHGGFAFGMDRLVAQLLNLESIREVIPFPKTQKAYSPITDAPSAVDRKQLDELFIKVDVPEDLT